MPPKLRKSSRKLELKVLPLTSPSKTIRKAKPVLKPKPKRIDYLSPLIDDCLFEIFDRLRLSDLCNVSRTNTSLRTVAGKYFQRKYRHKVTGILRISENNGQIQFSRNQRWVAGFGHLLKSVVFANVTKNSKDQLSVLLRTHFSGNLQRIAFVDCNRLPIFNTGSVGVLANVIFIRIKGYNGPSANSDSFLRHCVQLKFLDVFGSDFRRVTPSIRLPSLELIRFDYSGRKVAEKLTNFLSLNPTVKTIVCRFPDVPDVEEFASVMKNFTNIENIHLIVYPKWCQTESFTAKAKLLAEMAHLKRLEWKWVAERSSMDLTDLAALTPCEHLHISNEFRMIPKCKSIIGCKTLTISRARISKKFVESLARKAPDLEKLNLIDCRFRNDIFTPLARYSPQLRKIAVIRFNKYKPIKIDIHLLSETRKKLKKAGKITISIRPGDNIELTNDAQTSDAVVFKNIKACHFRFTKFNTKNPLMKYKIRKI